MSSHTRVFALVFVSLSLVTLTGSAGAQTVWTPPPPETIIASGDGWTVYASDIDATVRQRLARHSLDMYNAYRSAVREEVDRRLIAREAGKIGTPVDELESEIGARVPEISDAEAALLLEFGAFRAAQIDSADPIGSVKREVARRRRENSREILLQTLRKKYAAQIDLAPYRLPFLLRDQPTLGPEHARVTIIAISDFECPFCKQVQSTLDAIRKRFGDDVRIAFHNLPLPNHQNAGFAAEVALCAQEHGKFWPVHDALFEAAPGLTRNRIEQVAADAGVSSDSLNACVTKGTARARVAQQAAYVRQLGIQSTPTLIINGQLFSGAAPFQVFEGIITEELARMSK